MSIASMILARLKELGLAPTAAAKKFSIAYAPFTSVIAGTSLPNARTFKKYAKLLDVSIDDVQKAVKAMRTPRGSTGQAARGHRGAARIHAAGRGALARSLASAAEIVARAEAVLADELAVAVHELPTRQRRVIESVIGGFR